MEVSFSDRGEFARLAGKFRAAGKGGAAIRRELTATIQRELKSVVDDIKSEARSMHIRGEAGGRRRVTRRGGSQRRAQFDAALEAKRVAKATAAGRKVRARRGGLSTGLRDRVAASVKSKVSYTGYRMGAKVYVDASNFPGSQRKLPRHHNKSGGWRHPVFGHRDRWAAEFGEPYFDRPIRRHRDRVRTSVAAAVNRVLRTLR